MLYDKLVSAAVAGALATTTIFIMLHEFQSHALDGPRVVLSLFTGTVAAVAWRFSK